VLPRSPAIPPHLPLTVTAQARRYATHTLPTQRPFRFEPARGVYLLLFHTINPHLPNLFGCCSGRYHHTVGWTADDRAINGTLPQPNRPKARLYLFAFWTTTPHSIYYIFARTLPWRMQTTSPQQPLVPWPRLLVNLQLIMGHPGLYPPAGSTLPRDLTTLLPNTFAAVPPLHCLRSTRSPAYTSDYFLPLYPWTTGFSALEPSCH